MLQKKKKGYHSERKTNTINDMLWGQNTEKQVKGKVEDRGFCGYLSSRILARILVIYELWHMEKPIGQGRWYHELGSRISLNPSTGWELGNRSEETTLTFAGKIAFLMNDSAAYRQ